MKKKTMKTKIMMMALVILLGLVFVNRYDARYNNMNEVINETEEVEDNFGSVRAEFVHYAYPCVGCILGEEIRYQDVEYDDNGFFIDGVFISFELIDEHRSCCDKESCI